MRIDRDRIVAKIRALLSKTMQNGCTEEETLSALGKAREMMDSYEVTSADVELKGEEAEVLTAAPDDPHSIGGFLSNAIGRFCDCKAWCDHGQSVKFCGLPSDVALARWLLDSLTAFVRRELLIHILTVTGAEKGQRHRQRIINGFVIGCCNKIAQRLNALTDQSSLARTSNGHALVVAKGALITAKMAALHIRLKKSRTARQTDKNAFSAGHAAGDRADFGRPVSGASPTLRLGRRDGGAA